MEKLQFKQGYWSLNPLDLHKRHHSKISEDKIPAATGTFRGSQPKETKIIRYNCWYSGI